MAHARYSVPCGRPRRTGGTSRRDPGRAGRARRARGVRETPIGMLDPGAGKTKKADLWAYARGAFEPEPGVVFDFCPGRGGKYPIEFLRGWRGTLVVDAYAGYDS